MEMLFRDFMTPLEFEGLVFGMVEELLLGLIPLITGIKRNASLRAISNLTTCSYPIFPDTFPATALMKSVVAL